MGLVTGGASGLGRATAERFVREGARVIICDLPKSAGQELAEKLGENATFSPTDVSVNLVHNLLRSATEYYVFDSTN